MSKKAKSVDVFFFFFLFFFFFKSVLDHYSKIHYDWTDKWISDVTIMYKQDEHLKIVLPVILPTYN